MANTIKIGNIEASAVMIGNSAVSAVYIGSTKIYPSGGTVDYSKQYLTIESLEDDNAIMFKLSSNSGSPSASSAKTISVSTDDGDTWTNYTSTADGTTIATLNMGQKVLIRGNNDTYYVRSGFRSNFNCFTASKQIDVNGNIMSLIYGDDFNEQYSFPSGKTNNFSHIFNSAPIVSAENLILPATTLAQNCYSYMFDGCTNLVNAPVLPATTLASGCYGYMFSDCTSLVTAPTLPATILADSCYDNMFSGCTSLTTAPTLPATTLASECYSYMFNGCTSLVNAPELPATTLAENCYEYMFNNCKSLTSAPALPATTLEYYCYFYMFRGCTNLVNAPVLSATTLAEGCYSEMFNGCTNLNYIKCLATDISATNCTSSWVTNVASTGTFIKASSMSSWTTGDNGIPNGWTVVTE